MNLSPDNRIAGVLVPLFALRGENDLGIGDVSALREFIDWIAGIGFKLVQLLPINETGSDNSPYNAISAMAIEPTTLYLGPDSPEDLTRQDVDFALGEVVPPAAKRADASTPLRTSLSKLRRGGVKYRLVKKLKRRLLEKAFAEAHGVALMGDIPFGVSYYSADVFARPDEFMLEWSGGAPPEPHFKDDAFTQKWGQNWGIPLYRWDRMGANNFESWRQRIRAIRRIFHLFRIDHVLGFYRIYAFPWRPRRNKQFLPLDQGEMLKRTSGRAPHFVPRDDQTPENCEANKGDGEKYLRVVLEEAGATRVIGEDLGMVPDYVRPSLRSLGIAGFKIPQWETSDGEITPGDKYERLSVATYATHDHKPLRALWEEAFERATATSDQSRFELEKIARFAGLAPKIDPAQEGLAVASKSDFEKDFYPAIMEALFRSNAWIAIVMITDLLARKYRFNVPGTKTQWNWTRRMQRSIAQLRASPNVRRRMRLIHQLLEKTGRV